MDATCKEWLESTCTNSIMRNVLQNNAEFVKSGSADSFLRAILQVCPLILLALKADWKTTKPSIVNWMVFATYWWLKVSNSVRYLHPRDYCNRKHMEKQDVQSALWIIDQIKNNSFCVFRRFWCRSKKTRRSPFCERKDTLKLESIKLIETIR